MHPCFSGCPESDDLKLVECMRQIDDMKLANMTKHFLHCNWIGPNVWKPYVDNHIGNRKSVLPDFPENLITSGVYNKVPLIIGSHEA